MNNGRATILTRQEQNRPREPIIMQNGQEMNSKTTMQYINPPPTTSEVSVTIADKTSKISPILSTTSLTQASHDNLPSVQAVVVNSYAVADAEPLHTLTASAQTYDSQSGSVPPHQTTSPPAPHVAIDIAHSQGEEPPTSGITETVVREHPSSEPQPTQFSSTIPWWKKNLLISIAIFATVILIVSIGVGLTVFFLIKQDGGDESETLLSPVPFPAETLVPTNGTFSTITPVLTAPSPVSVPSTPISQQPIAASVPNAPVPIAIAPPAIPAPSNFPAPSTPTSQPPVVVSTPSAPAPIVTASPAKIAGLTNYINSITLAGKNISMYGNSSEDHALAWIINNDPTFSVTESWSAAVSITPTAEQFRLHQRYALLTLWFQQVNGNGMFQQTWTNEEYWADHPNECVWYGVSCNTTDFGGSIGQQGVVTVLDFFIGGSNNVSGTIPADIGLLSNIQLIDFSNNDFHGAIPSSLGRCTALTFLDVRGNALTEKIPIEIGQCAALTYLDISYNQLDGSLPYTIGQWTGLSTLQAAFNTFDGTLPTSVGQWSDLEFFNIGHSTITGMLPSNIGQWTALTYFNIESNEFNGMLPSTIGLWTNLKEFRPYNNMFTGTLPSDIGQWTALTDFNVGFNDFTGTIPTSVGNWSSIAYAYFYHNDFTGTIPMELCNQNPTNVEVDCMSVNCTCCARCQ